MEIPTPEHGKLLCDVQYEGKGEVSEMTSEKDRGEILPREFKYNPCVICPNKAGSWSSKLLSVLQCPLLFLTSLVMGQIFALRTEWLDLPEQGKTLVL